MVAEVVTIDGPAGSGKTSVAERVAAGLGFVFLNTGAMYRAATLAALDAGVDVRDADAVVAALERGSLALDERGGVRLAGQDVSGRLNDDRVSVAVSVVSQVPGVRARLTAMQRAFGLSARPGLVAEGRDMATVVFPDARHRFFLDAALEERTRRHLQRMRTAGKPVDGFEVELEKLRRRDHLDSTRALAPLVAAPGAVKLDTTHWDLERTVREVLARVRSGADAAGREA